METMYVVCEKYDRGIFGIFRSRENAQAFIDNSEESCFLYIEELTVQP
jgi:hypothetical protein